MTSQIVAILFTIFVSGPIIWLLLDRTPPVIRLYGTMDPPIVERGSDVRVRYIVTKRIRPETDCPGTVQQEIVDSSNTTYSKLNRQTGPAYWESLPGEPDKEVFYGQPVTIPAQAAPGQATFRTVTFRHCNALQQTWPFSAWPIIQIGPDIKFTIVCRQDEATIMRSDRKPVCVTTRVLGP